MTQYSNTFEGGSDTTTITVANSGGGSGDAFSNVSIGTGASLTYSATNPVHGSLGLAASAGTTSTSAYVEKSFPAASATIGGYFYLNGSPPSTSTRVFALLSGTTTRLRFMWTTAGRIQVTNAAGTTVWTSTTQVTSAAYRLGFSVTGDATNGALTLHIYSGDTTTAVETASLSAQNFGGTIDTYRLGIVVNVASVGPLYFDDLIVNDTGTEPTPGSGSGSALAQTFTDTVGLTGVPVFTIAKALTDPTNPTDGLTAVNAKSFTTTDQVGLGDAKTLVITKVLTDRVGLDDNAQTGALIRTSTRKVALNGQWVPKPIRMPLNASWT